MKKRILTGVLTVALSVASVAHAGYKKGHNGGFTDYADVVDVQPVVRVVEVSHPRQECWQEQVRHPGHYAGHGTAAGSMIVGGLIGGVIGNQFGSGRGKDYATLAGTVVGASLGHDHAVKYGRRHHGNVSYEQRCRTVNDYHTEERVDGYRVTYVYQGQTFHTRLPYDPGERMRVRITVSPQR